MGIKAAPASRQKLINNFKNHPNVGWLFLAEGWFNLAVGIWAKDNAEINDIGSQVRNLLTPEDQIVFQSELTSLYGFGNRAATNSGSAMCIVDSTIYPIEMSALELDYIKLVTMDSTLSTQELAQLLNISEQKVRDLHEKMIRSGVIVGTQQRLNYAGLYYKIFIDTLSRKDNKAVDAITARLWEDPKCIYFARANSKYDLEFELILESKTELANYLKDFFDYQVAILKENIYTNLYPFNKIANLKEIKDALKKNEQGYVDFRNSKLWYLNYKGAGAYLSIYENRQYFETMEKSELDLFSDLAAKIKSEPGQYRYSIIDIGSGDGLKGRKFAETLGEESVKAYYPVDIQPLELAVALRSHKEAHYAKHPVLLNIEALSTRFPLKVLPGEKQIFVLFGGTYGNFQTDAINSYLKPLLADLSAALVVSMPIVGAKKTDQMIIDSYTGSNFEEVVFGPLAQIGFNKNDFERGPHHPDLILHFEIKDRRLVSYLVLKNDVRVFDQEFKKGTVFKMTSSWKPSLEQFRAALEQDFKIESIINNADMAIAIIRPESG